ncbi:hypothetical protein ACIHFB_32210 [Streptomyces sp. NPDC051963]|uniref:hypothetical protein n=1 Tax=Streptomyces sp. NPDC051963 TaxID=3365678 RepID=UPI0037D06435
MSAKLPTRTRSTAVVISAAALVSVAALLAALAPEASAAPALPLPLSIAGAAGDPLVNVDGHVFAQPLVNNLDLPHLK